MRPRTLTADRTEFLGRNGSLGRPAALDRGGTEPSRVGPGLDPCAALQASFDLPPGEETEVVFLLGQAPNVDEARRLRPSCTVSRGGRRHALQEVQAPLGRAFSTPCRCGRRTRPWTCC